MSLCSNECKVLTAEHYRKKHFQYHFLATQETHDVIFDVLLKEMCLDSITKYGRAIINESRQALMQKAHNISQQKEEKTKNIPKIMLITWFNLL